MADSTNETATKRGPQHDAMKVFLGRWRAEGKAYGGPNQSPDDPKGSPQAWMSTHTGEWHTGEFFVIQDERAIVGDQPFDTLSVMGVDPATGRYFARSFDNLGFFRHYNIAVDGHVWMVLGETERARIVFSEDGRTQTIVWEWRPKDRWLPLCDRVARRDDRS